MTRFEHCLRSVIVHMLRNCECVIVNISWTDTAHLLHVNTHKIWQLIGWLGINTLLEPNILHNLSTGQTNNTEIHNLTARTHHSTKFYQVIMASSTNESLPANSLLNLKTTKETIYKIRDLNRKFRLSCSQLILINNLIDETEVRYHRAQAAERRSYRYILRLKLCTLEGVRNMFYEYAYAQADVLEKMQLELYEKTGIAWNDRLARLDNLEDSDAEEEAADSDDGEDIEDEDEDGATDEESMDAEDS